MKLLIGGCGSVASEFIKNALFLDGLYICIVDNDKVEVSNLNRQFVFKKSDIGKYKVDVVKRRFQKKLDIKAVRSKVQEVEMDEYNNYDVIVCTLDNIEGRMHLNYVFKTSKCKYLIDIGVEGYSSHCKIVTRNSSCLYCIKNLYIQEEIAGCTLRHLSTLDNSNRRQVIMSLVLKARDMDTDVFKYVISKFNGIKSDEHKSLTSFELKGIIENTIPSVGYMCSISASLGYLSLLRIIKNHTIDRDFIFLNLEKSFYIKRIKLNKDSDCILCNQCKVK